MLKENIKRLKNELTIRKQDIPYYVISFIITLLLLSGYQHLTDSFVNLIWIINIILWLMLIFLIMLIASFIVLESFFRIATGFSLLILLSQSYCESSGRSIASDNALNGLLSVGFLYLIFIFYRSLSKALKENYKSIKDEKKSKEKTFFMVTFMFFTGFIIIQILMVVSPIINDSCVLKPYNSASYSNQTKTR